MSAGTAVSIIIPVYNAEAHLSACIASARNQTLANLEIICVDDGSTDQSRALLDFFAAQDARIRIYDQANLGAGSARNLALAQAKGEFVSFLDADDCYATPTCLEELYCAANRMQVSICGGFRQLLLSDNRVVLHSLFRRELTRKPQGVLMNFSDFQYDYHFQNYIFQRTLLQENQIQFPLFRRFQDPPFLVRAMLAAKQFAAIPSEVYLYRCISSAVNWNAQKVCDLIKGLTENLLLSRAEMLPKLHRLSVYRFEHEFCEVILAHMQDPDVFELCLQANNAVDIRLLKRSCSKRADYVLLPIRRYRQRLSANAVKVPSFLRPIVRIWLAICQFVANTFRCVREHGFCYTVRRAIEHLGIPMNAELPRPSRKKKQNDQSN